MTDDEYQKLAMRTMADQRVIRARYAAGEEGDVFRDMITAMRVQLDTALRGLTGEVGEIASTLQKWTEYNQDLNVDNLKEEIGDCCWRLAQMCDALGFSLAECMSANIEKLKRRYPDKYDDSLAKEENRNRKAEAEAVRSSGRISDPNT